MLETNENNIKELKKNAPILISAPLRRSGTTLVQRLLCSSNNTLIYGENCASELQTMVDFYLLKQSTIRPTGSERERKLKEVLCGNANNWIADLMPPSKTWLAKIKEGYFNSIDYLQEYAQSQNRSLWGVKLPEWDPLSMRRVINQFPLTKVIYIKRNHLDCLQSAIAIGMIRSKSDEEHFLKTGAYLQMLAESHLKGDQTLFISYEKLVKTPKIIINQIEEFSGAKMIQPTVMHVKINDDGNYVS